MERDINMEFIWSAVDWEPPASTDPAYTVSSSGTVEYACVHCKGKAGKKLFTFLAKNTIRRLISVSCL